MMTVFFILGTAATSWKKALKQSIRGNAVHESTRTAAQVIANAGVAAISGLLIVICPSYRSVLLMAMAGSLSAAAADTLASELGMVYGRRFYHILTGRPDEKGLDGVISLEGLLIGSAAAAVIALVYILGQYIPDQHAPDQDQSLRPLLRPFLVLILSGTLGNLTDSVLGAALERKGLLSNDAVNFCSTLVAALAAGALAMTFGVFTP